MRHGGSDAAAVAFRKSTNIDDRMDDSIGNGTKFEALVVTENWVQVTGEKWLPRQFVRKLHEPQLDVASGLLHASTTDSRSAVEDIELRQPFVGKGRPHFRRIISAVDRDCSAQAVQNCAVLACGPTTLLQSIKDAIAQTKTEADFEFHQETFEF